MTIRAMVVLFAIACSAGLASAVDSPPAAKTEEMPVHLGQRGQLLLEDSFSDSSISKSWTFAVGKLENREHALHVSEVAANKHAAAFRHRLAVQDCAVQFNFRFQGARMMHFGYDPAPGELKKKGHLFSVIVTPKSWTIQEHIDKSNPQSKNKSLANESIKLDDGKWYTMLVECKGDQVRASIDGIGSISASSMDFHVKKPGLVFRVGSDDDHCVAFDNIRVWELK